MPFEVALRDTITGRAAEGTRDLRGRPLATRGRVGLGRGQGHRLTGMLRVAPS
jgi:hypothetical protein